MANTLNLGDGNWATREDSLLGYNLENNNFKPLPFDFTRSSSATRINKNGLIERINREKPRIDFLGNTKGALLLEPQRTNLFLNSEPTSNENAAGGITYESFNWFLGFSNCIKFGDNSSLRYRYGATVSATTQYTISAFVIMDDLSEPLVGVNSVTGDFAFVCGGVSGGVANENIYYGNNIYRVSTTLNAGTNANNSGIIKYTSQSSKGFRVVGLQIEQGGYATSYIPTVGSAATRVADVCDNGGNDQVINSTEGVLYFEGSVDEKVMSSLGLSDGSGVYNNTIAILFNLDSINQITSIYRSNNITTLSTVPLPLNFNKIAIRYFSNTLELWLNGVMVGSETFTTQIASNVLNSLQFEKSNNTYHFYGNVKDVKIYNNALTNDELEALTGEGYDTFNALALADNYTII